MPEDHSLIDRIVSVNGDRAVHETEAAHPRGSAGDCETRAALFWEKLRDYCRDNGVILEGSCLVTTVRGTENYNTKHDTDGTFANTEYRHRYFAFWHSHNSVNVIHEGRIDGLHRHFGTMVLDTCGVLHMAYRRGPRHHVTAGAAAVYTKSLDGGTTWSQEEVVYQNDREDCRDITLGINSDDRILIFASLVTLEGDEATRTDFVHFSPSANHDGWELTAVDNDKNASARMYGKLNSYIHSGGNERLSITAYEAGRMLAYESMDNGDTWFSASDAGPSALYSEFEIEKINDRNWFAIARGRVSRTFGQTVTRDAGISWTHYGDISGEQMRKKGGPSTTSVGQLVLLAFVDRDRDSLVLQTAPKSEVMSSATVWSERKLLLDHMENASGYGTVLSDSRNGDILFLVFREYQGNPWSDVLFLRYPVDGLTSES